jgi:hypothetical protein
MTDYTFEQIQEALETCTGYQLVHVFDDDYDEYILVDQYGNQDGDAFACLDDVLDYVTNNEKVNEYLKTEFG